MSSRETWTESASDISNLREVMSEKGPALLFCHLIGLGLSNALLSPCLCVYRIMSD
jgi:hypothetical protein